MTQQARGAALSAGHTRGKAERAARAAEARRRHELANPYRCHIRLPDGGRPKCGRRFASVAERRKHQREDHGREMSRIVLPENL